MEPAGNQVDQQGEALLKNEDAGNSRAILAAWALFVGPAHMR